MPEKFVYPFFFKVFYTYGNIPFTLLLIFYVVQVILSGQYDTMHILFLVLGISMIILLNRKYFQLYKNLPLELRVKDDTIIAQKYFLSGKILEMKLKEISRLSGGIFEGKISGMIMLIDESNEKQIVISDRIKNYNVLLTTILSKINKPLYDEAVTKIGMLKKRK